MKKGDRFRAATDVAVTCLVSFAAPVTGGYEVTLPAGTVVVVSHDEVDGASAIACDPEEYRRLEKQLVRWRDRARFWDYGGYHVMIRRPAFGNTLLPYARSSPLTK